MMLSDRNQKQTLHDSIHMKHAEQTKQMSNISHETEIKRNDRNGKQSNRKIE